MTIAAGQPATAEDVLSAIAVVATAAAVAQNTANTASTNASSALSEADSALAVAEAALPAHNPITTGLLVTSLDPTVTAVGSTSGTAYLLVAMTTIIVAGATNTGVRINELGVEHLVVNLTGNTINIYPYAGSAFPGFTTDQPIPITPNAPYGTYQRVIGISSGVSCAA